MLSWPTGITPVTRHLVMQSSRSSVAVSHCPSRCPQIYLPEHEAGVPEALAHVSSFIASDSDGASRSRSDIIVTGSGQEIARTGSLNAIDTSSAGSWLRSMR
jgi:hypothetical protein